MSMENAILAHAAALTELAAAVRALVDSTMGAVVTGGERIKGNTAAEAADKTETKEKSIKGTKAEPTDETKAAIAEADKIAENRAAADKAHEQTGERATGDDEPEAMDYNKDVKPRLLAVVKKVGKEKLGDLIKTFGAEKADGVDPAKFPELLAAAEKLEK